MTYRQRKRNSRGESSLYTDSSESSGRELDLRALRNLLRDLRESLSVLCEWTDGIVAYIMELVHVQLSNIQLATELSELDLHSQLLKAIQNLPGSPPTVGF